MSLAIVFIVAMTYVLYRILKKGENIKVDKIVENARYVESVIQKRINYILEKDEKTAKYVIKMEKMLKESVLGYIGLTNIYVFFMMTVVAGYFAFKFGVRHLNQIPAAILIAIVAIIIPFQILEIEVSMRRRSIRRHLPHFFLTVLQLLEATEDITDVIETIIPKIKKPLNQEFSEFIRKYKSGKEIEYCTAVFKSRVDNPLLIKFADDIESNVKNGTRLKGTIEEYVIKAYNNELNYTERITENSGNISGSFAILAIFIYTVYQINKVKPDMIYVLTHNFYGQVAVNALIILLVIGILIMKYSISFSDSK